MAWKKLGLVFSPESDGLPGRTHASLPVPLHLHDDRYRVFFASRDDRNHSSVFSVDIKLYQDSFTIIDETLSALFEPGPAGYFDDCGVYPSSIVKNGSTLYLYYIGWCAGAVPPMFYTNVGLAISNDNGKTFQKFSPAPICGRDSCDPWMMTSPFVLKRKNKFLMWYVSGDRWDVSVTPWQSYYHIKSASSDDGIQWSKENHICLPLLEGEYNISRLCVLPKEGGYEGWFGFNAGNGYRIGYAVSPDGLNWQRHDDAAGISLSLNGWDSETISYPYIIDACERRYMFYNGNGFGRTGFGVAIEA